MGGRKSKIATGRMAKSMVMRGKKEKTTGGLTKEGLMGNKRGKIVSKRMSALGKQRYRNIEHWTEAIMAAREALHTKVSWPSTGRRCRGRPSMSRPSRSARQPGETRCQQLPVDQNKEHMRRTFSSEICKATRAGAAAGGLTRPSSRPWS